MHALIAFVLSALRAVVLFAAGAAWQSTGSPGWMLLAVAVWILWEVSR